MLIGQPNQRNVLAIISIRTQPISCHRLSLIILGLAGHLGLLPFAPSHYVEIPKGTETEANREIVYKLLKALYGLKQFPRLWYERLANFLLKKLGLKRINADHSTFVTKAGLNGPVVSTFIDDIKIMAPKNSGMIERVKLELTFAFSMVDMGSISFYLGLKVQQDRENEQSNCHNPPISTRSSTSSTFTKPTPSIPQ